MKLFRFCAYAGGVLLYLAGFTSHANAACGPKIPSGLSVLSNQDMRANAAQSEEPPVIQQALANNGTVVGLWLVTITVDGQPFGQAFEAFTSDGTEILNDSGSPQAGNVCLGVWAATAGNTIRINHPSWNYDNNGNVIGTVVLRSEIVLEKGGNAYHGTTSVTFYDINGNQQGPPLTAQLTATRITP